MHTPVNADRTEAPRGHGIDGQERRHRTGGDEKTRYQAGEAEDEEFGELQPLPSPASTPLSLALPAGTYQISLAGPRPQSKRETVTLRVNAGQTSVAPVTRFQSLTVEEYFDESLGGAR